MLSKEELNKLSVPDAELTAFLAANPFPTLPWSNVENLRAMTVPGHQRIEASLQPIPDDLEEPIQVVTARDGHELRNRVVRLKNPPSGGSPLILLIHGGGFMIGNNVTQVPFARVIARQFGAVVVCLQYRLAPEHAFPTQQHDIIDNIKYIASNASSLHADPSKGFVLGGSSAGGQLSAVVAQHLADEDFTPKITGLWQNVTVVLTPDIVPEKYREHYLSRDDPNCVEAVILNSKDLHHVDGYWKPDYKSAMFSPFNSPKAHQGMPPRAFFQVCGGDPLRDDSFVYEDALKEAGVETKMEVYAGLPHGFNSLLPGLPAVKKWQVDFFTGIGWLLGQNVTPEQLKAMAS